jgi:hypothetical protein
MSFSFFCNSFDIVKLKKSCNWVGGKQKKLVHKKYWANRWMKKGCERSQDRQLVWDRDRQENIEEGFR